MSQSHNLSPLAQIEALLFVSGEPVSRAKIAKLTGLTKKEVEEHLNRLSRSLVENNDRGIFVIEHGEAVELATKKELGSLLETLAKSALQEKLSQAALEVLAIVAYRAPITRAHIEAIRGVNCSFTLRNLLLRGLIERSGNPEDLREYVYSPTFAFLEKLGFGSVKDLPEYEGLSRDSRLDMVLEPEAKNESINQNQEE